MSNQETSHTPGPWNICKHATPSHAPQFGVYADGDRCDLAIVVNENARANAVLISAAPDMLALLTEKADADCFCQSRGTCWNCRVRATISKAREAQ